MYLFYVFFRMILTTTMDMCDVSSELSLMVNSIRFSLSRNALYEIFLNKFMCREKSRLEESLMLVNKVRGRSFTNYI